MNTIPLSSIVIRPNRQRQEFNPDALQDLKASIEYDPNDQSKQLYHPPVLRQEGGEMVLVAGERRLKVLTEILDLGGSFKYSGRLFDSAVMEIPYTDLGELSELEAEEAELDENLKRKDLTWQEHAAAVARLHELRQKQNPKTITIDSESDPEFNETIIVGSTHTVADTAQELLGRSDGSYQDAIRKEIIVAQHLDNPAVAKAKDVKEAFKILKADEERKKNIDLAIAVGKTFSADSHRIINTDCIAWMRDPSAQGYFDVIATDPPYGMDAHEFGDGGGKLSNIEHHYDDTYENWKTLMSGIDTASGNRIHPGWCKLAYDVCKPQAHAYVFCDIDNFHELKALMQAAGWYVFRTPFILFKINSGRVPLPDKGPRRQYETLLYAIKGGKLTTHIYPDVISANADASDGHGAQKPVAVWQNLLQRSVKPGDKVLDSFAGTGGLLPAGHGYKCEVTLLERAPEYYGLCLKRAQTIKAMEAEPLF